MNEKNGYFVLSTNRVLSVSVSFNSEYQTNTALIEMFGELATQNAIVVDYMLKLDTSTKKFTIAAEAIRDKAAKDFSVAASAMSAYGAKHNNTVLEGMDRFTFSELRRSSLSKQLTDSAKIMEIITQNASNLESVDIDTSFISILTTDQTQIESIPLVPQNMIDQHKNDNTLLVSEIDIMRAILDKQIDKAMQIYRIKNLPFYLAYTAARKVRHHHLKRKLPVADTETTTGILELLVLEKNTESPLSGVKLLISRLNLIMESDQDGETYTDKLTPGNYQAKLSSEGYKDIEFVFVIEAGKTCTLQFLMEKI